MQKLIGKCLSLPLTLSSKANFASKTATPINFPVLKQLALQNVSISRDVLDTLLSGCHCLESLSISVFRAVHSLRVISPTLRCISISDSINGNEELVMVSSVNSMCTVKVLALRSSGRELHTVLNVLGWFPCLENLYIIFYKHGEMDKKNELWYDTLHPVKCLQNHLKNVLFNSFVCNDKQIDFARFFLLNAKVLNKIEFEGYGMYNNESVAVYCKLLQVENRASQDATFELKSNPLSIDHHVNEHIHKLSVAEPFRQP